MLRTAESVSPKHPDKLCDRISDAILDACLGQDANSRVAIETMGGHGIITITGELTTGAYINAREIAQRIAGDEYGVQTNIVTQSSEIANGMDTGGAGDQGIMVGYACDETPELMPLEVMLARKLNRFIYNRFPYDGKTQVTLDSETKKIKSIVASFQNTLATELKVLIRDYLLSNGLNSENIEFYCNPAGDWNQGGFDADTGLTGRKLIVDNYGPRIPIGGGAFSGKDSTKVDRSAAYMARRIAVDILREHKAHEVYVTLAYAIGVTEPIQATAIVDRQIPLGNPFSKYDLTPQGIIKFLDLKKPQFELTAQYGHFGNGFLWDK